MLWKNRRQSGNIEDRRGGGTGKIAIGGIGTIVIALIVWAMGGNPLEFLQTANVGQSTENVSTDVSESDTMAQFVSVVLAETEDVWDSIFQVSGQSYQQPKLVIFSDQIQSACGFASEASGPFYCPGDAKVYLDMGFFNEMKTRFEAPGDFAIAYVIAHEVGHHIQNLLGILDKAQKLKSETDEIGANKIQVKVELQADFLAGVWAHYVQKYDNILEEGDIEEAMNAANAVGDDRLQKKYQGTVVPDAFTHGTSEQRMKWFMKGFKTGDLDQGNTLSLDKL